jgi:hypothetical protein
MRPHTSNHLLAIISLVMVAAGNTLLFFAKQLG